MKLRAQLIALAAIVLVVMSLVALFTWQVMRSIDQARGLAVRADSQAEAAGVMLDVLQDAETGQRGFLLTLRPAYLEPYQDARSRNAAALEQLDRVTADDPPVRVEAAALRDLATRKMAELARTIDLARSGDIAAAIALVETDEGGQIMNAARASAARLASAAMRSRDQRIATVRLRERQAAIGALAVTGLGVLLLAGAMADMMLRRERLRLIIADRARDRRRLAGAIANLPDGMAVFDAVDQLLLWNQRLFEIGGLPAALAAVGTPWSQFASAAASWPGTPLAAFRPGASPSSIEVQVADRVVETWRAVMPDGGQMLVLSDTTRRNRAEAIARQANKMEALGQLTGSVAHDFNNLLQVVSANLELIGIRLATDAAVADRVAAAMAAVERASRLTRYLLAFARKQPLAPEVLDTDRLLRGMEDMLHRTVGQAIELEFVMGGGIWAVRADPAQLENAVLNLAINARDAMPDGGRLTIEASNASLDGSYAAVHDEVEAGQYVMVAITDTGIGMNAEQIVRAMEPFYTTKAEGRGTGLGLPMVFGFAKQSGGHFKLYSEPGHGTTARLYLPRSAAAPRAVPTTPAFAPDPLPGALATGELVLLVEDDPNVRAAAQLAVQGLGYRTVACENTAAALAELRGGLRPDLLFSDVVMPGRPGAREMAEEARRLVPNLAVVFTSGYTENSIVHNGQLDPGVILVSKPWRSVDLARQFRAALHRASLLPAEKPSLRILLVEDDGLVRMITADLLISLGHDVMQAGTGAEARRLFAKGPDLVITDIGLPDVDGMALAAEFRSQAPDTRILVVSGQPAESANDYVWLQKPYNSAGLKRAIARALAI